MEFSTSGAPRVSVIIPVHNNEAFVGETLNSLKEQTFNDFEALCIDDGSTDGSARIIQELEAADQRFHYIFQENAGAASARNNGLRNARGEYIAFLDGDDLYSPNCLKRMIGALDKTQADVCICERESFNSKSGKVLFKGENYKKYDENRPYNTQELADSYYDLITVFCWDKMYRHSFLQKHPFEFQKLQHCNDVAFVCSVMAAAQTICFVKESLVRYRVGTGGSTQDRAAKEPLCALEAFNKARENVFLLHETDAAWQKSIDTRCADAFFNTLKKVAGDDTACREVYDAFKNKYEREWSFREKPLHYFGKKDLMLKMWSYRRTSYEEMRKIYFKLHKERGKKKHIYDYAEAYGKMLVGGLLKR